MYAFRYRLGRHKRGRTPVSGEVAHFTLLGQALCGYDLTAKGGFVWIPERYMRPSHFMCEECQRIRNDLTTPVEGQVFAPTRKRITTRPKKQRPVLPHLAVFHQGKHRFLCRPYDDKINDRYWILKDHEGEGICKACLRAEDLGAKNTYKKEVS